MQDDLTIDNLSDDEVRVFVTACELDNADRGFTPAPEYLPAADKLVQLGVLKLTFVGGEMCFDLSPAARTADRLHRLTETAQASVN
jgi:hypothetical protein